MKKYISVSTLCLVYFASCVFGQEVDSNTYYFTGTDKNKVLASLLSWKLSDGSAVTELPSATTNLVWDKVSGYGMNYFYSTTLKSITVNSAIAEFNLNGGNWVRTSDDFVVNYNTTSLTTTSVAILQAGTGTNGFDIGGNMNLNSSQNLMIRMKCDSNYDIIDTTKTKTFVTYKIGVGGQLQMNSTGTGVIRTLLSDSNYGIPWGATDMYITAKDASVEMNLGGLSGKGVISETVYFTTKATVNFQDNASSAFAGGEWEGALTMFSPTTYVVAESDTDSVKLAKETLNANKATAESHISFVMNGNGKQSMTVYKAANAQSHGISGIATETDMTIDSLTVNSGEFVMDTELAVTNVVLSGGKLTFTSPEKITTALTLEGGKLGYTGTISTNEFSVPATSIDVIFTSQDLQSQEIVLVQFDYLGDEFDADSIFAAYNESGEKLGGTFVLNGSLGEAGTLTYQVPEPATVAAIFGMAALALAAWRRRK